MIKIVLVVLTLKKNGLLGFMENSRILLYATNATCVLVNYMYFAYPSVVSFWWMPSHASF